MKGEGDMKGEGMDNFARIEEQRERSAELEEFEKSWRRTQSLLDEDGLDPDRLEDILAYGYDDPKRRDFHSVRADLWDARPGK